MISERKGTSTNRSISELPGITTVSGTFGNLPYDPQLALLSVSSDADYIFEPQANIDMVSGSLVSELRDYITGSVYFTSSGDDRPTLVRRLDGRRALRFNGNNKMSTAASAFNVASNNFSITVVWDYVDTMLGGDGDGNNALFSFMGSGGDRHVRQFTSTANLYDGTAKGVTSGGPLNKNSPSIITVWGNGSNTFSVGNSVFNSFANGATLAGGNITEMILGMLNDGTYGFIGDIIYLEIGEAFADSTAAKARHNEIRDSLRWPQPKDGAKNQYIFVGDSITAGQNISSRSLRWPDKAMNDAGFIDGSGYAVRAYGSATTDLGNSLRADWLYPNLSGTGANQVIIFNLMRNSLNSVSPASNAQESVWFFMRGGGQYFPNIKAAYPDVKIAVMTMISSSFTADSATRETERLALNTTIKTSTSAINGVTNCYTRSGDNIDYVIDIAALAEFDTIDDVSDTTYYQTDGIHITDAACSSIASTLTPFINYLESL